MDIVLDTYSFLSSWWSELHKIISSPDEMTPSFIRCGYTNSKEHYEEVSLQAFDVYKFV